MKMYVSYVFKIWECLVQRKSMTINICFFLLNFVRHHSLEHWRECGRALPADEINLSTKLFFEEIGTRTLKKLLMGGWKTSEKKKTFRTKNYLILWVDIVNILASDF